MSESATQRRGSRWDVDAAISEIETHRGDQFDPDVVDALLRLFLPGGIGGDGYKIYVLQKNHDLKMINVFHAVLWDRICGIFALVFLAIVLLLPSSFATKFPHLTVYSWVLLAAIYPCAYLLNKLFYKQFIGVFTITAIESMLVQVTQVISVFFILKAMSHHANIIDYLAIFLISTIATIIPITIGGAGAREITFLYLLGSIQLETSIGVALSLIFFAISLSSVRRLKRSNASTFCSSICSLFRVSSCA